MKNLISQMVATTPEVGLGFRQAMSGYISLRQPILAPPFFRRWESGSPVRHQYGGHDSNHGNYPSKGRQAYPNLSNAIQAFF